MSELEVWITGTTLPGRSPEQAASAFAQLAKISPEKARVLLTSGQPRLIKRCASTALAEALTKRLADIGVAGECRLPQNSETGKPTQEAAVAQTQTQGNTQGNERDWMTETIIVAPSRPTSQVGDPDILDKGVWCDTPNRVSFLHGFRWHVNTQINEINREHAALFAPLYISVYGALVCFMLFWVLGKIPASTVLFPVVMGLFSSLWGFCYARNIQTSRQGGKIELFASCKPGPQLQPLLVLGLSLAVLWYFLPLLDLLLCRLHPECSLSLRLICLAGSGCMLVLGGHFVAAALAVTQTTGFAGLARVSWAGIRNGPAFLACTLVILPLVAGICFLFQFFLSEHGKRFQSTTVLFCAVFMSFLAHLMDVAYAAARSIFYEERREARLLPVKGRLKTP